MLLGPSALLDWRRWDFQANFLSSSPLPAVYLMCIWNVVTYTACIPGIHPTHSVWIQLRTSGHAPSVYRPAVTFRWAWEENQLSIKENPQPLTPLFRVAMFVLRKLCGSGNRCPFPTVATRSRPFVLSAQFRLKEKTVLSSSYSPQMNNHVNSI